MICEATDCRVILGAMNRTGYCRQHRGLIHKQPVQREGVRHVTVNRVQPGSSANTQLTTTISLPKEPWDE